MIDTQIGASSSVILGGTLTYTLTSLDGKTVVTQGVATSSASFDRFPQRFANIRANRDAEIKLAKDLAAGAHPSCRRCWRTAGPDGRRQSGRRGRALRRPDPRIGIFLFYGPDMGLINERARPLAERSVDDPSDPFQLIRIDGDDIAADPGRLADEPGPWVCSATARHLGEGDLAQHRAAVDAVLKGELQDYA